MKDNDCEKGLQRARNVKACKFVCIMQHDPWRRNYKANVLRALKSNTDDKKIGIKDTLPADVDHTRPRR
jgi:hypothetical protein